MLDVHPYTLLVVVAVVVILKNVLAAVGKAAIQVHGWGLYSRLAPRLGHSQLVQLAEKQHQLAAVHRERKAISAQDHYAKWTKLNRQHDKLAAEIAELQDGVLGDRAAVSRAVGVALTVCTTLPIWFFRVWFRKSVLFYLPPGVLPYYMEWFLAIPFFQVGCVGLSIWMMAVNNIFALVAFLVTFLWEPVVARPVKGTEGTKETEKPKGTEDISEVKAEVTDKAKTTTKTE